MTINIIGVIYKTTPSDDPENPIIETLTGWHVNSDRVIDGCDDYLLTGESVPEVPYNLFAGVPAEDTFFYVFPDEATAQSFGIGLPDPVDELI